MPCITAILHFGRDKMHEPGSDGGFLLNLIPRTPVYLLRCTPDECAVQCLEQQLFMDGVISHE